MTAGQELPVRPFLYLKHVSYGMGPKDAKARPLSLSWCHRNRNQRKVNHTNRIADYRHATYNHALPAADEHRRGRDIQTCGRSRGEFFRSGKGNWFGFNFLPFTIQHPASAGRTPKISAKADIFGAAICAFDKLGANDRYLSVRRHALRRSLALAADNAPLSPPNGGFLLS